MREEWSHEVGPVADSNGRKMRLYPNEPDKGHMRVEVFTDAWKIIGFVDLDITRHYYCHPKDGPIDVNHDGDPPPDLTAEQALKFLVEELRDLPPQVTNAGEP